MGARGIDAQLRRYEREAQRRQRDLERRAKEQAKLSTIEQAKLEVESYENTLEVLLSVHKEQGKSWDWLEVLTSLPPVEPQRLSFFELRSKQRALTFRADQVEAAETLIADGRKQDGEAYAEAWQLYSERTAEWNELRGLARKILDGEHKAYTDALVRFSPLGELADLGSAIHFTVHDATLIECALTLNGQQVIPKEVKALTASEKLSVKPMPKGRFQEIYEDHICGCVLRIAREVFALLVHGIDLTEPPQWRTTEAGRVAEWQESRNIENDPGLRTKWLETEQVRADEKWRKHERRVAKRRERDAARADNGNFVRPAASPLTPEPPVAA